MNAAQFMLLMNLGRTVIITAVILWLIFTTAKLPRVRFVAATGLMCLLASNICSAAIAVGIFKVSLW